MGLPMREQRRPKKPTAPPTPPEVRAKSSWVEEKDRDTSWYLFHRLFHVRVQFLQMLSIEELQHFGMPITGDPVYDKQIANESRDIMLSIQRMCELYDSGATVAVVDPKDTKRIYEHIENHLEAWATHIRTSMNKKTVPVKDLLLLDRFAHSIYEFAKYRFADEDGFIASLITQMNGHQLTLGLDKLQNSLLSTPTIIEAKPKAPDLVPVLNFKQVLPPPPDVDAPPEEDQYPRRKSMADYFAPSNRANTAADAIRNGNNMGNPNEGPKPSASVAALLGSLKKEGDR